MQRLRPAAEPGGHFIQGRVQQHERRGILKEFFPKGRLTANGIAPVVEQMMVQVDFYRADFGARAAKR